MNSYPDPAVERKGLLSDSGGPGCYIPAACALACATTVRLNSRKAVAFA
jgi:hypothetical protein